MTSEKRIFQPPTSSDVCKIYNLLYSRGLVSFPIPVEAEHKIESIIATVEQAYFDVQRYATIEEKAVAYLYFLIKDHPFVDGNKRTAVTFFLVYCSFNNLNPSSQDFTLDQLAVYIERRKDEDVLLIIQLIAMLLFGKNFYNKIKKAPGAD